MDPAELPPPVEPSPPVEHTLAAIHPKLARLLQALDASFLERDTQIRAAFLAMLSGHHVLFLGPPGTAKSLLARALCACLRDAAFFEYLLSKFTHPDELFGPVSIPGLKEEDYRRLTEGYLPRAEVAFLDEIFKANSAILNSLLALINERVFHHGKHRDPVPLVGIVGASNEVPEEGGGLEALYDRFLVRIGVPPLADPDGFLAVCLGEVPVFDPPVADKLTRSELDWLRAQAATIAVDPALRRALVRIRAAFAEEGVQVSDRRWRWAMSFLRMSALTSGRSRVSPLDVTLLEHCFGDPGATRALVRKHVRENVFQVGDQDGHLAPLEHRWAELGEGPVAELAAFRMTTVRRLDEFDGECARARSLLDVQLEHMKAEVLRTPWCSEVPPEFLAGLVAVRTRLHAYQGASTKHRAAVAAYGPASLLVSQLRQAAREDYYAQSRLRIRAPTDAPGAAVCLDERGQPLRSDRRSTEGLVAVIDDETAHRALTGGDAKATLEQVVAHALLESPPPRGAMGHVMGGVEALDTVLSGLAGWIQKQVSPLVPTPLAVAAVGEHADGTRKKKRKKTGNVDDPE